MTHVTARPGESFDGLLGRFRRAVQGGGVLAEYRRKQRFTPAHELRREKLRRARRRQQRALAHGGSNAGQAGGKR